LQLDVGPKSSAQSIDICVDTQSLFRFCRYAKRVRLQHVEDDVLLSFIIGEIVGYKRIAKVQRPICQKLAECKWRDVGGFDVDELKLHLFRALICKIQRGQADGPAQSSQSIRQQFQSETEIEVVRFLTVYSCCRARRSRDWNRSR